MKLLYLLFFLTSCSYFNKHEGKSTDGSLPLDELRAKYEVVYAEVESSLDQDTGWPSMNDCDATLFAGLACSIGFPVKIELAEYTPGEIHRRPYKACWNETVGDVGSESTISRDMLTGYTACLWKSGDLEGLKRLANYGEKNAWIMGKPKILLSRVLLGTNLTGALGRAIYKLSDGDSDRAYRHLPTVYPPVSKDYERHIQVQGILLQDSVDDNNLMSIDDEMLARLKENALAFPDDQLFAAALGRFTGDQNKTVDLLLADTPCSSYVRGEKPELYCKINWLQAAKIVLDSAQ